MLDKTRLLGVLAAAGIGPHCQVASALYQNEEILRQRPWAWRFVHNKLHPRLADCYLGHLAFCFAIAGATLMVLFAIGAHPQEINFHPSKLALVVMYISFMACFLLAITLTVANGKGRALSWRVVTLEHYTHVLQRPVHPQVFAMIDRIRSVSELGSFRVKYIGKDPILNYYLREEFEPTQSYDILVWDENGKIVYLPRL